MTDAAILAVLQALDGVATALEGVKAMLESLDRRLIALERGEPAPMNEPSFDAPIEGLGQYQSVKRVRAGEITEVIGEGCYVKEADGLTSVLRFYPPNMIARYTPQIGDFWVVYDGGYQAISPRAAFIAGYVAA